MYPTVEDRFVFECFFFPVGVPGETAPHGSEDDAAPAHGSTPGEGEEEEEGEEESKDVLP